MASPSVNAEATNAPAPSASDRLTDFEKFLDEDEQDSPEASEGDPLEEGEELELDEGEEQEDEGDEPETAIETPVSLNAEEKKAFAAASPEAQQAWAASETRRNAQVQEATTKAASAQRTAEATAAQADATAKAVYAQQLDQWLTAFEPEMPDPQTAYSDPARYIAEKAQYDATKAQHDNLVQQVRGINQEANTEAQQAFVAQRDRELMTIADVANPETRQGYLDRVMDAAELLGYDRNTVANSASAADIKAIAMAAEWKAKADRLDKAVSKQMQKVRASKGKNLRPNAAPHAQSRTAQADEAWKRVKSAGSNKAQRDSAAAEWFEAAGIL